MLSYSAISCIAVIGIIGAGLSPAHADTDPRRGDLAAPQGFDSSDVYTPSSASKLAAVPSPEAPSESWSSVVAEEAASSETQAKTNARQRSAAASVDRTTGCYVWGTGGGQLSYYPMDKTELSKTEVAQVNLSNGNLLVSANDGVVSGPGVAASVSRWYNDPAFGGFAGPWGGGWQSSLSSWSQGLCVSDDKKTVDFIGKSGYIGRFTRGSATATTFTSPTGLNATMTYSGADSNYAYTVQFNQSGEQLKYSSTGFPTADLDRNGVGLTFAYTDSSHPYSISKITSTSGRSLTESSASGADPFVTGYTDFTGRKIATYEDTRSGNGGQPYVNSFTNAAGAKETYTYETINGVSQNRLLSMRLPAGSGSGASNDDELVKFTYDTSHRVTAITRSSVGNTSAAAVTKYAYGSGTTTVTDPNGHNTVYTLDNQGRVVSTKDANGHTRSQTYTPNSDIATSTDALASGSTPGNTVTRTYDGMNNPSGVSLPTGAAASAVYAQGSSCPDAGGGNPYLAKCSTDDAGNTTSYAYDAAGNQTSATDTSGGKSDVEFSYVYEDASRSKCGGFAGQVCSATDGNGGTTTYTYNTAGDLAKVTPPAPMAATSYSYDALGRVTSVINPAGDNPTYEYDALDRQLAQHFNDNSGDYTTTYFPSGLVKSSSDTLGGSIQYTWDVFGRQLQQRGVFNTQVDSYTYDKAGNVLTFTDAGATTKYVYDATNKLVQVIEPGGSCTSGTTAPAAASGCVKLTYNANGQETKRTLPGGASVLTTYDAAGRETRVTAKDKSGATVSDVGWQFNYHNSTTASADRGNVQRRIAYKEVGLTAGATTDYTYDSRNRLSNAAETVASGTDASWSYGYDANGNRTTDARTGTVGITAGVTTFSYNANNQITSTSADTTAWTYDAAGNETTNGITGKTSVYNTARGTTAAIGPSQYYPFGPGNTNITQRFSPDTNYVNTALGLTSEAQGSTTTAYTRTPAGAPLSSRTGTGRAYYITDNLASVIGMFDANGNYLGGYSYSPYGETRAATNNATVSSNSLRYIGGYWDASAKVYHLGARYYDPSIGRFTQQDPTGQEANPYAYANDDPINSSDPSGTSAVDRLVRILDLVLKGYAVSEVLTSGDIATFATGVVVDGLCSAALAAVTGGVGVVVAFGFCTAVSATITAAVSNAIEGKP
ncbi:RHS repeat-associated protein [Curtobacterium sp. PhB142]|nr:RHS repeat-associated protein [Curtobacterium sp. PhB142]TCM01074.1 RHS repeat-associated protein [Curtobacterium sp. PhB134]